MDFQTVINELEVTGIYIILPTEQLDRNVYVAVKDKLEKIGGKYNKKLKGFSFKSDPSSLLSKIQNGEKVNIKKDFQFFETPLELANRVVEEADIKEGHLVLEPSAGRGAIALQVSHLAIVDVCELFEENATHLKGVIRLNFLGNDFLSLPSEEKYDRVVANPPFSNNQDIDHIRKMYSMLKPGGRIVSVASSSWTFGSQKKQVEFREWLDELGADIQDVEEGTFKESGTNVRTTLIIIDKAA